MTSRRDFLIAGGTGLCLLAVPFKSFAQQPGSVPRIGLLWIQSGGPSIYLDAFREGLRVHGYVEGKNVTIDERFLVEGYEGLAASAARLSLERVSVIVTMGGTALQAAHKAAPGIPIVIIGVSDPVKLGLVASLSRPGGNVTGIATLNTDLSGKRLELLKELVPSIRRIAVLLYPGSTGEVVALRNYEAAARALNLETRAVEIRSRGEIDSVVAGIAKMDVQAVAVVGSTLFNANRQQLAVAIGKIRLPAIFALSEFVESGGLIAYGTNYVDQFRQAAAYVDKILKGAKPADLPVEQPTKFELVVNLKTAKALGITIPQSILVRADRMIN